MPASMVVLLVGAIYSIMPQYESGAAHESMKSLLREPLFHFFLIGAVLFGVYARLSPEKWSASQTTVVFDIGDLERLAAVWEQRTGRPPGSAQLRQMVDEQLREEVFYREAKALDLDDNDIIIRRRLAQKMSFLSGGPAPLPDPGDAELATWFQANQQRYAIPEKFGLSHVYFSTDKRGANAGADARAVLASLQAAVPVPRQAPELGDPFMLRYEYTDATQAELEGRLGESFGAAVEKLEPGRWHGPVRSGYGEHLVFLESRVDGRLPELAEVRTRVLTDWRDAQFRAANERLVKSLLEKYRVTLTAEVEARLARQ